MCLIFVYTIDDGCSRSSSGNIVKSGEGVGGVGSPLPFIECRLVDEAGNEVSGCNTPGELRVRVRMDIITLYLIISRIYNYVPIYEYPIFVVIILYCTCVLLLIACVSYAFILFA